MKNNVTRTIRSEEITIDVRICAALAANRGGEVYLAAIAPDMELTVITLDEAPDILPCFEEDDACLNLPNTSLLLCYNPAQVLKMGGKHYLTGPVILVRTNMDGEVISLTIDEVYLFQKYLESHSITLMADDQKLPCICIKINNRIESLERRIQEAEAAEVNEMVRTAKVTPEQLAALLRQSTNTTPNPAALSAVGATIDKEDPDNEDDE